MYDCTIELSDGRISINKLIFNTYFYDMTYEVIVMKTDSCHWYCILRGQMIWDTIFIVIKVLHFDRLSIITCYFMTKNIDNVSQCDIFISNSYTNITLWTTFQSKCVARTICLGNYSLANWARPIGVALKKETSWHSSGMSNILIVWCNKPTTVHRNG